DYLRTKLDIAFDKSDYYDPLCARHLEEQTWEEEASGAELYDRLMRSDISDNGIYSGVDLVDSIVTIYDAYGFDTQVIAASVRNARQAREVAEMGVDIATLPFHVIEDMLTHPKTLEGMQLFTRDVVPEYEELFE
ncbi:MAG: transaldolase family protein, partial [Candidatus Thermoplasmatota archaeon]|nr:transaldolase family protein [Candidatus Thermoplasmatota archaeon]